MTAKQESIQAWLKATDQALEALHGWRAYLQVWQQYEAPIQDDFFMAVVQDMAQAGLLEWMDGSEAGLDNLREVLTEGGIDEN